MVSPVQAESRRKAGEFPMIYLKSTLAGLLALVAATVVLPILVIAVIVIYTAIHSSQEGSVGWDPISLVHQSPLPIVALMIVCFTGGFSWEFRRLAHRRGEGGDTVLDLRISPVKQNPKRYDHDENKIASFRPNRTAR